MWSVMVALALAGGPPSQPPAVDAALVQRIQAHYDQIQDFEAHFIQRVVHRIVHKVIEESGTMAFKRPGRMRWEYQNPENKLFVTDGEKSYFYVPEDRQVIVSHTPGGAMGLAEGSPFAVMMGETRLLDAFEVKNSDSGPQVGGEVLLLIPHRPQEDFEEAEIEVRPEDGQVMRVSLLDSQGNRTEFLFDEIRENRGLLDSMFRFSVPSGVDILIASDSGAPSPLK
jgi:outer membrane lipoprotein carrier protein